MVEYKVSYVKESIFLSIIKDIFTFGLLFFLYWLNYSFLGNSRIIIVVISFYILIGALGVAQKKYRSIAEMKVELARLEKEEAAKNGRTTAAPCNGESKVGS